MNIQKERMLEEIATSGQLFGFNEHGDIVSVQDLLGERLGREVGYREAVAYVIWKRQRNARKRFIGHFITYARTHKHA